MTDDNSETDLSEAVAQHTADLGQETTGVVKQAVDTVNQAAQAAEQSLDVADELMPIFDALSRGKRARAIDAALGVLSGDTSQEAREAVSALKATRREANRLLAEFDDLAGEVADVANDIEDAAKQSEILDTVTGWFGK